MKPDRLADVKHMPFDVLVDRGHFLYQLISDSVEELKLIEERIKAHALEMPTEHQPLVDEDREGKRWVAQGNHRAVPVVFTADKIVGSFQTGSPLEERIRAAMGSHVGKLWHFFKVKHALENRIDDGKKFRALAAELLDKQAPAFITACIARDKAGLPKSDIKVEWSSAKEV